MALTFFNNKANYLYTNMYITCNVMLSKDTISCIGNWLYLLHNMSDDPLIVWPNIAVCSKFQPSILQLELLCTTSFFLEGFIGALNIIIIIIIITIIIIIIIIIIICLLTLSWRTLQNVIHTQKCEPCQLNKLTTLFPAGGFPPDTASSTCRKAQAWPQFNRSFSRKADFITFGFIIFIFILFLPECLDLNFFSTQIHCFWSYLSWIRFPNRRNPLDPDLGRVKICCYKWVSSLIFVKPWTSNHQVHFNFRHFISIFYKRSVYLKISLPA